MAEGGFWVAGGRRSLSPLLVGVLSEFWHAAVGLLVFW